MTVKKKLKETLSLRDFKNAFSEFGRDEFSPAGLEALYNYLSKFDDDRGEKMELYVITLCCKYTEYEDFEELNEKGHCFLYGVETMEELKENTLVIMVDDERFIIRAY